MNLLNRIKLQQLRTLDTLMRTRNMTRSAEVLNSTQPTISRQLSALEQAIGFKVFSRGGSGQLVPTAEGERFFKEIGGLLAALDALPAAAAGARSYSERVVRVHSTLPLLLSEHFLSALDAFAKARPDVQLRISQSQRPSIGAAIAGGQGDIGFAAFPIENSALDCTGLLQSKPVAVVSRDHPLATRSSISFDELDQAGLILNRGNPIVPNVSNSELGWLRSIPTQIETRNPLVALKMVAINGGLSLCDQVTATAFRDPRVRVIALDTRLQYTFGYFVSRNAAIPKEVEELISHVLRALDSIKSEMNSIF